MTTPAPRSARLGSLARALSSGLLWAGLAPGSALPAGAALAPGDLDGDGSVGPADEALLAGLLGSSLAGGPYDPAGDLNGDGRIDGLDVDVLAAHFGTAGGEVDREAPGLFPTLNDIPGDMNDLLVVPPDGFQITVWFDSAGGSAIDLNSFSIRSSEDIGALAAGTELAPLFAVEPRRAVWEIPAGSELARTSHFLSVRIRDLAGNEASESYGFAVRDFASGPPLQNLQTIFLDFDQDRGLGPEIDFLEDLREYGLSSNLSPRARSLEPRMRERVVVGILARVHRFYGRNPDGSPGPDAAHVVFVAERPSGTHSRLCVGGVSSEGAPILGAASLDLHNRIEASDECAVAPQYGIFPQALDDLWGESAEFQAAFDPLDPGAGGTAAGEHRLDPGVLAPGFDPVRATAAERARAREIEEAVAAFAQAIASAIAHETGHMLGLTAPGPPPAGLFGGRSGAAADHDVTPAGDAPAGNFLMNMGGSFSFEALTGRGGQPLPRFRALDWAYLRDRVALDPRVTGLFPAPELAGVEPGALDHPARFAPGQRNLVLTFRGANFLATPRIALVRAGEPGPDPVLRVTWVDGQTLTAVLQHRRVQLPAVYDVQLVNPDGQELTLPAGLSLEP